MTKAQKIAAKLLEDDMPASVGDGGGKRCGHCGGRTSKEDGKRKCRRCGRNS